MLQVENIYYLLCYAWGHADLAAHSEVAGIPNDRVSDLLGHVLATRMSELLRRGLHREYITFAEDRRSPKGKLDVSSTVKRLLRPSGRVACMVDEFDYDVLLNQIVGTTVMRLATAVCSNEVAEGLRTIAYRLPPLSPIEPKAQHFARVRLHRMTSHYSFVLHLCELILRSLLPGKDGRWQFVDFTGSEQEMGLLFEAFLRAFLKREQRAFRVSRSTLIWSATPLTKRSADVLPFMQTDLTLQAGDSTCILEAKACDPPLVGEHGRQRIRGEHLYQLLAYLRNMQATGHQVDAGALVYASAGAPFEHRYRMGSLELRVVAIDLDQPWQQIRAQLMTLASELAALMNEASTRRSSCSTASLAQPPQA
jgi:5-methylcytosine-specific restriction enzyme subunit McrC